LNMYEYLKINKVTKLETVDLIESSVSHEISQLVVDLEDYLEGGSDDEHKLLREGYGHLGKPEARKIKNYLTGVLSDMKKYEQEKRPGRKRKSTK